MRLDIAMKIPLASAQQIIQDCLKQKKILIAHPSALLWRRLLQCGRAQVRIDAATLTGHALLNKHLNTKGICNNTHLWWL